jgi:hypothetical protein
MNSKLWYSLDRLIGYVLAIFVVPMLIGLLVSVWINHNIDNGTDTTISEDAIWKPTHGDSAGVDEPEVT